jgi:hypothetical protein
MLSAVVMGGLWLAWDRRALSWTLSVRVDDVDDRLQVQITPCSARRPGARYIAVDRTRPQALAGRTVAEDEAVAFGRVTSDTVVTLQLYNDVGGPGGLNGIATADGRRVFTFRSPEIPRWNTQRVWASSFYGDGRPAPLPARCRKGLAAAVVRAASPSVRPAVRPYRPPSERRDGFALASAILLALCIGLGTAWSRSRGGAQDDPGDVRRAPGAIWGLALSLVTSTAAALHASPVVWHALVLVAAALIGYAVQPYLRDRAGPALISRPMRRAPTPAPARCSGRRPR